MYFLGASLPNSYNFEQLHFHWGNNSNEGSEHEIDGKRYPLEMHLVHYNSKYKSASEAVKDNKRDGLAVISVLFEISKHDNEDLEPIIKKTQAVSQGEGEEVVSGSGLGGVSLADLLPKKADKKFFTYSGSLTTPPLTRDDHHIFYSSNLDRTSIVSHREQWDVIFSKSRTP